jgi:hypothetical protein
MAIKVADRAHFWIIGNIFRQNRAKKPGIEMRRNAGAFPDYQASDIYRNQQVVLLEIPVFQ